MPHVRQPAVAGSFYPADPVVLARAVDGYIAGAKPCPCTSLRALVMPHAGYLYSGPVAGSAIRCLAPQAGSVRTVVLIGPAHRVWVAGVAASSASAFRTPLGDVSIDPGVTASCMGVPGVAIVDAAHAREHCLEVELPFLQRAFPGCAVVPLLCGRGSDDVVEAVLEAVWDAPGVIPVVSTDLSHYEPYAAAQRLDAQTAAAVLALEPERIADEHACGAPALRALCRLAKRRGGIASALDLRNSGDTAGGRSEVVGYAAFGFSDG
ncbi:MAG: AmmeMemoRadiSam system protein B [Armatimonadetes bacterium]|nr:AmmeMemoRadiSam system protein B [Armatimonadota bacterium]